MSPGAAGPPALRRWLLPALLLVLALATFLALDRGGFLSLAWLKHMQADIVQAHAQHPVRVLAAFFAVYVLATALSVPAAGTLLTLAAGAVFGLATGVLVVSFAATLGAVLAMLSARHLARDALRALLARRFGKQLASIDAGMARDGGLYLFTLRVVPLFPYFVVNLVMGLTAIPLRSYWVATQLGMLPGTAVYVYAGTQLGRIDTLADVASPAVLVSLLLMGVFPLLARWALRAFTRGA